MIATWVFGLWLAFGFGAVDWSDGLALWLKAAMVIALSGMPRHPVQARCCGLSLQDQATSGRRPIFRAINEIPFVIAIIIVIAVIVKPF
jgi:putative membrane protein